MVAVTPTTHTRSPGENFSQFSSADEYRPGPLALDLRVPEYFGGFLAPESGELRSWTPFLTEFLRSPQDL